MMPFKSRSINLTTLLGLMASVLVIIICSFASAIFYSDYKFNQSVLERSEAILSRGLLRGAMPLAIAANDNELIRSIVSDHIAYDEIYAVEIRNMLGEQIHRQEETTESGIHIIPKTFDIVSPYNSVALDDFEPSTDTSGKRLGTVTIYFTTARIQDSVKNQLYFAVGTIMVAILICFLLIYMFKVYLSSRLSLVVNLMGAIKRGDVLESYKRPIGVNELSIIDASLRDMVKTIYERENQVKLSLEEALRAQRTAQEAEEFKDEFIRRISHDIKTPVGVVSNLLSMIEEDLKQKPIDKEIIDKVSACHQSAKVLADLTGELFDLEEFQMCEHVNRAEPVNVREVFDKIKSLYAYKFHEKGLLFKVVDENPRLSCTTEVVMIDANKLILVIENLVDNALKFTNDGSVIISWKAFDGFLTVSVRDSGIGIPEDKLDIIFHKHKQLGDLTTDRKAGRGLGLFYVNRRLAVLSGVLTVSSKLGIGSVFEFKVPYVATETKHPDEVEVPKNSISVLIIDDNEQMCFTLHNIFKRMGVSSSFECIPEMGYRRWIKEKPELVIIDYHMQNLSGDQIARRAREILPNASCFVCLTAEASPSKLAFLEEIFQVVLRKPLSDNDIRTLKELTALLIKSKSVTVDAISNMVDK